MPDNTREMITMAERNFHIRIRIGVPPDGPGDGDGASRVRGVLNDATSIYFAWGPRERLRGPMVRRVQGRGGGRRVPDAGG